MVAPPFILTDNFLAVITTLSILLVVPSGKYAFTVTSFSVWPQLYLSVLPPFEELGS
jgi:hypothetical protein